MTMVLIRHFTGRTPDGMEHGVTLTAGITTPPEALEHADRLGVKALEHKFPGIRNAVPVGDGWTEYDLPDENEN